ncbi:hypothetical protein EDB81DRAFT_336052 [Dactylonectria macrodidyma]|uniref:Uncharacterized protein n=1 Tax=Dactylonectria macrodidyma TaxID=307937 RepID=A0A9P9FHJ7_9HYPO|nr:hypothetical protein EDB81DRAFT_336052 [Dactylonectria macrodidyma]
MLRAGIGSFVRVLSSLTPNCKYPVPGKIIGILASLPSHLNVTPSAYGHQTLPVWAGWFDARPSPGAGDLKPVGLALSHDANLRNRSRKSCTVHFEHLCLLEFLWTHRGHLITGCCSNPHSPRRDASLSISQAVVDTQCRSLQGATLFPPRRQKRRLKTHSHLYHTRDFPDLPRWLRGLAPFVPVAQNHLKPPRELSTQLSVAKSSHHSTLPHFRSCQAAYYR